MKNKLLIFIFTNALTICILLSACSDNANKHNSQNTGDYVNLPGYNSSTDYSLVDIDGSKYIIFDRISKYENNGQNQLATIDFTSVKDFYDVVTKGQLEEWQKSIIVDAFPKDKNGIPTCDFDNLFEPVLPDGGKYDSVSWRGQSYSYSITFNNEIFGFLHCYTREEYNNEYADEYEGFFDKETINVSNTDRFDDGKTATYYSTSIGEFMQIRYTITSEKKVYVVDKTFRLKMNNASASVSDELPINITLYCVQDDTCFVLDLFGFADDPSDIWLLSFGLKAYAK